MLDYKSEALLLVDFEGDVLLSNAAFNKMSGYDESAVPDLHIRQLLLTLDNDPNPLDQKQLREFRKTMFLLNAGYLLTKVEVELTEIEGQKFLCQLSPKHETANSGNVNSEPVAAQGQPENPSLSKASPSAVPNAWTAEQQHNIRTALNGIMGFASMLQREAVLEKEEKLKNYLGNIRKNGNRLMKIIEPDQQQHTLVAKKVNLSVFDPSAIVQKLINKYAESAEANDLTFETLSSGGTKLLSDQSILEFVLEYFFQKAALFCRNDSIRIKLDKLQADLLQIEIDNIGQDLPDSIRKWLNEYADNKSYAENAAVLDDDQQFKTIIKQLNKLDAKIKLTDGQNGGDIVKIMLSSVVENPEIDVELELMQSIRQHKPALLIVEDERINAQILNVYLKDLGEVVIAYTGNEAINLIRQKEMSGSGFDIILMDIGLPEPWNGVSLKEHILRSWNHYEKHPFIAQTAYVHEDWTSFIESGRFAGFLTKPINRLELLLMINKLLKV